MLFSCLRSPKKPGTFLIFAIPFAFVLLLFGDKFQHKAAQNSRHQGLVVGVSFAQNEPFESSGREIRNKILGLGFADNYHLFNRSQLVDLYPDHERQLTMPGRADDTDHTRCKRVGCVIQKPLAFLWAMNKYPPGTWIFWTDSSQYFRGKVEMSVKQFVDVLDKMGMDALPGAPLCRLRNVDTALVDNEVFKGMGLNSKHYWYAPHYQNSFFAFRNIPKHRAFMEEWLLWLQHQEMVARSHTEDQAVFSLLVTKHRIPSLHFCLKQLHYERDFNDLKDRDKIIYDVIDAWEEGNPMSVYADGEFMAEWREDRWPS